MAEYETEHWGTSKTSLDTLDSFWEKLLEILEYDNEREEIKYLLHCTTLSGKKAITGSGRLYGGATDLPARAPLASYSGLKGIWMAPSPAELPRRSPYGTQRMVFRVGDVIKYLGTKYENSSDDDDDNDDDDKWDTGGQDDKKATKGRGSKKGREKRDRKKKQREVIRKQKDYLKHKIAQKAELDLPLLFFECAHHYGSTQYVRLLLVRASDPKVEWCKQFCKEIELCNNPFFEFETGRVWTYRIGGKARDIVVELLVIGDVVFDKLRQPPDWDDVGTLSRAGFDPRIGLCQDH